MAKQKKTKTKSIDVNVDETRDINGSVTEGEVSEVENLVSPENPTIPDEPANILTGHIFNSENKKVEISKIINEQEEKISILSAKISDEKMTEFYETIKKIEECITVLTANLDDVQNKLDDADVWNVKSSLLSIDNKLKQLEQNINNSDIIKNQITSVLSELKTDGITQVVERDSNSESSEIVDYLDTTLSGKYSRVTAGHKVEAYSPVECQIVDGRLCVFPTNVNSYSPFFGIAQNAAEVGGPVLVLNEGISKVRVHKKINVPVLRKVGLQFVYAKDQKNKIITQTATLPIEKNDLLVISSSIDDILIGTHSRFHDLNLELSTMIGMMSPYKAIGVDTKMGSCIVDQSEQNRIQKGKKLANMSSFITVLDPTLDEETVIALVK